MSVKSELSAKIVVTAALPYANGSIHIGSLLEYIQADIFVRFLKLQGHDALYLCASDMHGTPIEVNAAKAGIKPELFVTKYWKEHQRDFKKFLIKFDDFYKTHSSENKQFSELFFNTAKQKGYIYIKEVAQMYDEKAKRFLPDRFVKGTCPKCQAADQYGDVCEKCGATYAPADLLDAYSVITNTKPIVKNSKHYFFALNKFSKRLQSWLNSKQAKVQPEIQHQLQEWLTKGLEDWCISRDAPYFGFPIPGSKQETGETKYFYVWLDAPIGYIATTAHYCSKAGGEWQDYWKRGKIYHIIGKDIVYFHYLFWPALLMAMEIPLPEITTHGFITVNGQKMSKSRGTLITASQFAEKYPAEALRFYYAYHLDQKLIDIDFNLADFMAVNNNVLMGNLGNFCYRVLTFANKNYRKITAVKPNLQLEKEITEISAKIANCYQEKDFKAAASGILSIADLGNAYFQAQEPWKHPTESENAVGFAVNIAKNLAILVSPILPEFSRKILFSLGLKKAAWEDLSFSWAGKAKPVEKLVLKLEESKEEAKLEGKKFPLQLAVGLVKQVIDHPQADSLFVLTVDFGKLGLRQSVTSLKKFLPKKAFENKKLVFCLNLKPAVFRNKESNAMILAAEEGKNIVLLEMNNSASGELVTPEGMANQDRLIELKDFEKIKLNISNGQVVYHGKRLLSSSEVALVKGVTDKARVK